jgi:prepilin-type N-terminal cleavage/methylation domain-containing protein
MLNLKSMKINNNKLTGFTLIELLVVVAIIGILASVVIVNLNSARAKGQDSAIKQQLAQLRSSGELYYDTTNGYGTSNVAIVDCPTTAATFANSFFGSVDVNNALTKIQSDSGQTLKCALGGKPVTGTLGAQSWVTFAKLRSQTGFWCVDSSGSSRKTVATVPVTNAATTDVSCPAS